MHPKVRLWILIIAAIVIIAAIAVYANQHHVSPNAGSASLPSEYRGSAISASVPPTIPAALVPGPGASQEVWYSNPQSAGSSFVSTQSIADLVAFYKQGFATLDWKLSADDESASEAFLSAHKADGSVTSVTLLRLPDGTTEAHFTMQQ